MNFMFFVGYLEHFRQFIIQTQFLPGSGFIDTTLWMHYLDAN